MDLDENPIYRVVRESFLIGLAVVVPALLTLYLLQVAVGMLSRLLVPIAHVLGDVLWREARIAVLELASGLGLLVVVFLVGFLAHFRTGQRAVHLLDAAARRVPGVGMIYASLRRMSDAMVAGDSSQFREVKLVEFPESGSRMLGFVTNEHPDSLVDGRADDLVTLFVPLAPNPVMAGFLTTVEPEYVEDVDMTVEEGISAIVTFGTTVSDHDHSLFALETE